MTRWQRRARLFIAIFAVRVCRGRRSGIQAGRPGGGSAPDCGAQRSECPSREHERPGYPVQSDPCATSPSNIKSSSRIRTAPPSSVGVKVATEERGGRSFVVTGKEGSRSVRTTPRSTSEAMSGCKPAMVCRRVWSRPPTPRTMASVRASGPVEFSRGRLSGSGVGMTYDKNQDVPHHLRSGKDSSRSPEAAGATATEVSLRRCDGGQARNPFASSAD